ncbi:MAG: prepilin peptidase [Candidatus Latescibacteria bacterium]|jgi:leader peptidase (prepilin peptidase) / N-methyltransferase|nr:prepilin peptidase [Candidatus Latescibacterota bacterium]
MNNEISHFGFIASVFIAGFFGLSLGSFLNVIIYRLPRKESIVFPGSHCTHCDSPILYRDNIPVAGFILLRGKCRACRTPISWRYPLVEAVTGCMVIVLFTLNGFTLNFAADTALAAILLAAAMIDLKHMIIPNRLTYPGTLIAAGLSFRWGLDGIVRGIQGGLVGIFILSIMYYIGKLMFKKESMGMGDIKLAFVIGVFVGPFWCLIALVLAILVGGIFGIIQLATGKKNIAQEVPFGPFLATGGFCVLFFKSQIIYLIEQYLKML